MTKFYMIALSILVGLLIVYTICLHVYVGVVSKNNNFIRAALKKICSELGFGFSICDYDGEIYVRKYGGGYNSSKHPIDRETLDQNTERFIVWIKRLNDLEAFLGVQHFTKETPAQTKSGYQKVKGKK